MVLRSALVLTRPPWALVALRYHPAPQPPPWPVRSTLLLLLWLRQQRGLRSQTTPLDSRRHSPWLVPNQFLRWLPLVRSRRWILLRNMFSPEWLHRLPLLRYR